MHKTELNTGWIVEAVGTNLPIEAVGPHPVAVPGCVHIDLMAAGVLSDPYRDGAENEIRWMHGIDWRYSTTLRQMVHST